MKKKMKKILKFLNLIVLKMMRRMILIMIQIKLKILKLKN